MLKLFTKALIDMRVLVLVFLICGVVVSYGQTTVEVDAVVEEDQVRITYTLLDSISSRLFDVSLVAQTPKGEIPLTKVSGELGEDITVGTHEAVWDALAELERFDGNLLIEVKAVPQFAFLSPGRDYRSKRGKPVTFSWYGGNSTLDDIRIDLFRYDEYVDSLATVSQQSSYTWQVPEDIKPSGGYRIRLLGTSKSGLRAFSLPVTIDRRVPVAYKYIAAGTGAAGIVVLIVTLLRALPPIFLPE